MTSCQIIIPSILIRAWLRRNWIVFFCWHCCCINKIPDWQWLSSSLHVVDHVVGSGESLRCRKEFFLGLFSLDPVELIFLLCKFFLNLKTLFWFLLPLREPRIWVWNLEARGCFKLVPTIEQKHAGIRECSSKMQKVSKTKTIHIKLLFKLKLARKSPKRWRLLKYWRQIRKPATIAGLVDQNFCEGLQKSITKSWA